MIYNCQTKMSIKEMKDHILTLKVLSSKHIPTRDGKTLAKCEILSRPEWDGNFLTLTGDETGTRQ